MENRHPMATIRMAGGAEIVVELYPEEAPNTVNSFIYLARQGVFDHYAIQRVVPGWVLDVSYTAFGRDECKYLIANESPSQGFPNHLKVEPGVIAMGGYGPDEIAGGEWYFPYTSENLDGRYPAFGRVLRGWEEVERIEKVPLRPVPTRQQLEINEPITPEIIESVTVETFGVTYPEPVRYTDRELPFNWFLDSEGKSGGESR